jgi:uncharacterized membrane protein YphA (DoxX/SURF4 family)
MDHHHAESSPRAARLAVHLPLGLIIALVVLRLAVGWHFYREGTKKLEYNSETGVTTLAFSAEPFLRQSVGPVAEMVKEEFPNAYNWERYLAVPRQVRPSTQEEMEQRAKWEADYAARRKAAAAKKQPLPIEFPPHSPYYDWADRIETSWRNAHDRFVIIPGLSDQQRRTAAEALDFRRQQLADYLESQTDAIAEWEHELYRLEELRKDSASVSLPFLGTRIGEKSAEISSKSNEWIAQVKAIEEGYLADLRGVISEEQMSDAAVADKVDEALTDESVKKLNVLNVAVTALIIGSGVLLMLGLFTRVACIGAAGFLLSVIASQPPWEPAALNPVFYYQLVEIAALAVLFAAAAGQYAGLDYFIRLFTSRCCGRKESVQS